MKKLSIAIALVIGLSTAAFAHEGEKPVNEKPAATAFKADIMVYKNAKFALHFKNGGTEKVQVTVINQNGKVLFKEQIRQIEHLSKTYKLDEFPAGTYQIEVSNGETKILKEVQVKS